MDVQGAMTTSATVVAPSSAVVGEFGPTATRAPTGPALAAWRLSEEARHVLRLDVMRRGLDRPPPAARPDFSPPAAAPGREPFSAEPALA